MTSTVATTSTVPEPAGDMAVHDVDDVHDTLVAGLEPKAKVVGAPEIVENPAPVMVTAVPPPVGPTVGLSDVTAGW